ncbi:hypothetical protein Zmor_011243 [Zophobas morio]|uniref:Uncharacterized protein n=1 Tax=Zophobas morio TaxID=2755281 RepID=A0AA38MKN3_9CUCU|nr:hypothetical protein Zmor_011243 [Zophobas morio]
MLVTQKVPKGVTNEAAKIIGPTRKNNEEFLDFKNTLTCQKRTCMKTQGELELTKKLVYHFEKRSQEQEELILLLKENKETPQQNINRNSSTSKETKNASTEQKPETDKSKPERKNIHNHNNKIIGGNSENPRFNDNK